MPPLWTVAVVAGTIRTVVAHTTVLARVSTQLVTGIRLVLALVAHPTLGALADVAGETVLIQHARAVLRTRRACTWLKLMSTNVIQFRGTGLTLTTTTTTTTKTPTALLSPEPKLKRYLLDLGIP